MQKVTKRQAKEIQALKRLRDEEIDLTDIRKRRTGAKLSSESFTGLSRNPLPFASTPMFSPGLWPKEGDTGRGLTPCYAKPWTAYVPAARFSS